MRCSHNLRRLAAGLLLTFTSNFVSAQSNSGLNPVDQAQKQVIAYLADLADVFCKESVVQEKLADNGHVQASERSQFDYFIMMQGDGDDFQLTETRTETSTAPHKPLPMLVTNGFSTLLLIFHPYYRDAFQFEVGTQETVNGRQLLPVRFEHIPGRRSPAALALRGREYALDLHGTAWLDQKSGQVTKMDASLLNNMSDLGLRSLTIHVDYEQTPRGKTFASLALPALAVVDVQTNRQHWRNTHSFKDYKTFSTSAEQDPNVKVHPTESPAGQGDSTTENTNSPKEKP